MIILKNKETGEYWKASYPWKEFIKDIKKATLFKTIAGAKRSLYGFKDKTQFEFIEVKITFPTTK